MPLQPLATVEDLTASGVQLDSSERAVAERFLTVASAAVRTAARSAISQCTSSLVFTMTGQTTLLLPGSPVTAVDSVQVDGADVTDWEQISSCALLRLAGWGSRHRPVRVAITYTHGLVEVPADIVDLVCRITATNLVAWRRGPDGAGVAAGGDVTSVRIGDFQESYGDTGLISDMDLPDYVRDRLARRFGSGAAMLTHM